MIDLVPVPGARAGRDRPCGPRHRAERSRRRRPRSIRPLVRAHRHRGDGAAGNPPDADGRSRLQEPTGSRCCRRTAWVPRWSWDWRSPCWCGLRSACADPRPARRAPLAKAVTEQPCCGPGWRSRCRRHWTRRSSVSSSSPVEASPRPLWPSAHLIWILVSQLPLVALIVAMIFRRHARAVAWVEDLMPRARPGACQGRQQRARPRRRDPWRSTPCGGSRPAVPASRPHLKQPLTARGSWSCVAA